MLCKDARRLRLYCFSPPVMIATFAIEIVMMSYVLWRYRLTAASRLIALILFFLAAFQLSEYFVCGGLGLNGLVWSQVGYVCITALPPLGLHLLHTISGKRPRVLVGCSYMSMAVFIGYFLLIPSVFVGYECTGNYVIFQLGSTVAQLYQIYYFGWLLTALGYGYFWYGESRGSKKAHRGAIPALMIGYMVFLIPTTVANALDPSTLAGIPSIMCGFAVLFAAILTVYILPRVASQRTRRAIVRRRLY